MFCISVILIEGKRIYLIDDLNNGVKIYISKIFIVEDDKPLRDLYERALNINGYHVIASAKNGEEAVSMYKSFPIKPDVILMDHRMPIKNGLDASREILEMDGHPIIILASADKSVREEALSMGILSFKDKPFTLQRLFSNIEKALNLIPPISY